jgi:renalase
VTAIESPVPRQPSRVLVLGAGVAGLLAAHDLVAVGHEVTVVDKGRAVGGRLATRRVGDAVFDHGAQFLTNKHDDVRGLFERWRDEGVVVPWFTGSPDLPAGDPHDDEQDGHPRFRGHPTMRAIAEHLAEGLSDVRTAARVTQLCADAGGWVATAVPVDGGRSVEITATALVCTAPLPQTLALLDAGNVALDDDLDAALRSVTYAPTIAVLAVPEGPTSLPNDGALRLDEGPVAWLADGLRKGSSPVPAVVAHASAEVSRDLWSASDAELADRVLTAARPHLGVDARAVHVHRWRYATPLGPPPGGDDGLAAVTAFPAPIGFAGDAFAGGRVEGALRSGRAVARELGTLLGG